jgi:hypothetical protein
MVKQENRRKHEDCLLGQTQYCLGLDTINVLVLFACEKNILLTRIRYLGNIAVNTFAAIC